MKLSKKQRKVIGYTIIGTVQVLKILFIAAVVALLIWSIGSVVEVWSHNSAVVAGVQHEYSNWNLIKLLLQLNGYTN